MKVLTFWAALALFFGSTCTQEVFGQVGPPEQEGGESAPGYNVIAIAPGPGYFVSATLQSTNANGVAVSQWTGPLEAVFVPSGTFPFLMYSHHAAFVTTLNAPS